jgi:hypothetical protein
LTINQPGIVRVIQDCVRITGQEAAMTQKQLIEEIKQLPLEERMALLEAISRSVREELRPQQQRESAARRLRGIAKPDGPLPSDEEIKEDYRRYLTEKYS